MLFSSPESRLAQRSSAVHCALIAFGLLAFGLKAWTCFCLFPVNAWNDVRLRPSFLVADGLPLYPGLKEGVITTWIYGPAHPLLFLPVTLFRDIQSVYLAAGAGNVLQFVFALTFTCWLWPCASSNPRKMNRSILAVLAGLLVVPNVFLTIAQADNTCLVFGLLSLTCLVRDEVEPSPVYLWGAAFFGVGAAFAKLHGASVIAGELLWVTLFFGPKRAVKLLVVTLGCVLVWSLVTLSLASSPQAVWEHVVLLPSKLPWAFDLNGRLETYAPYLILMVLLPGVFILAAYRLRLISRQAWLPILVWLLSLPLGVLGALKQFGSINSLHGVFFLLPWFLIVLPAASALPRPRLFRWGGTIVFLGLGLLPITAAFDHLPRAPYLLRAQQAEQMASSRPHSAWLPWRPLANYLASGKNYHDEDGLFIRQVTGLYPSRNHAYAALPAQWAMTAIEIPGMVWGVARTMQPEEGTEKVWGAWELYSFRPSGTD
jgi:hypothetical protein